MSSPQQDWRQGAVALAPGAPALLALEVSYLLPVPAWFVHPVVAAPAAPQPAAGGSGEGGGGGGGRRLALDLSRGFGSFVTDPRYHHHHHHDHHAAASASAGAAAATPAGASLERLELCGRLAWRPSRVAALITRLRGAKGGAAAPPAASAAAAAAPAATGGGGGGGGSGSGGGGGSGGAAVSCVGYGRAAAGAAAAAAAAAAAVSMPRRALAQQQQQALQPPAPQAPASGATHVIGVARAAAWRAPADAARRFEPGLFMFTAEDHAAARLLERYGLLGPPAPDADAASCGDGAAAV